MLHILYISEVKAIAADYYSGRANRPNDASSNSMTELEEVELVGINQSTSYVHYVSSTFYHELGFSKFVCKHTHMASLAISTVDWWQS